MAVQYYGEKYIIDARAVPHAFKDSAPKRIGKKKTPSRAYEE
jgi:hypothetical protein